MDEQQESELVSKLKAEHRISRVFRFTVDEQTVYCRSPSTGEWRRFQDQGRESNRRLQAGENLVRSCVLFPEQSVFDLMLEERPGLMTTLFQKVLEAAGATDQVEKKVL